MYTPENHPLNYEQFEALADRRSLHSVSIYIPMDKKGKEQNEHMAQARLKNCIKEVHQALESYNLQEKEIKAYLKPIENLLGDVSLWRNPADGLALFLDDEGLQQYLFPIAFETKTYVANHFYLSPLLPLYYDQNLYHLLEISQDYIKLYEASKYGLKDLYIADFAPDQLEKAVGFDYKPKLMQFRSGHAPHGAGIFHGHGDGKDDDKKELFAFFRAVDKGVNQVINGQNSPLVLACVDSLYPIYKEANTYANLYDKHISGDSQYRDKNELHLASWSLVSDYFQNKKKSKIKQFKELYNTHKTSYEVKEIIPAAWQGKIDTLFLSDKLDLFGSYNKETGHVTLNDTKKVNNVSLSYMTALKTLKQQGNVYLMDPDQMPVKGADFNALYRY
ncbi:baeRF7 domain-containing protein [Sediminicola sp. 1XM1-17]|uniref:baeRF7 domain-containing protein n=1 Tax=Sediminicola sp. 1XM1-17 TaxID=3127702 RepID=UPI0030771B88